MSNEDTSTKYLNAKTCPHCGGPYNYAIEAAHPFDCPKNPKNKKFKKNTRGNVLHLIQIDYAGAKPKTTELETLYNFLTDLDGEEARLISEGILDRGFAIDPNPTQGVYQTILVPAYRVYEVRIVPMEEV